MFFETKARKIERLLFRLIDEYGYDPIAACYVVQTMSDVIAGIPIKIPADFSLPESISCSIADMTQLPVPEDEIEPVPSPEPEPTASTEPQPEPAPKPEPEPEPVPVPEPLVPPVSATKKPKRKYTKRNPKPAPMKPKGSLPGGIDLPTSRVVQAGKTLNWNDDDENGFILSCLEAGVKPKVIAEHLPWRTKRSVELRLSKLKNAQATTKAEPVPARTRDAIRPAIPASSNPVGKQSFVRTDGRENAGTNKIVTFLQSRDFIVVEQPGDNNQTVWKIDGVVYNKPQLLDFANLRRTRLGLPLFVYGV